MIQMYRHHNQPCLTTKQVCAELNLTNAQMVKTLRQNKSLFTTQHTALIGREEAKSWNLNPRSTRVYYENGIRLICQLRNKTMPAELEQRFLLEPVTEDAPMLAMVPHKRESHGVEFDVFEVDGVEYTPLSTICLPFSKSPSNQVRRAQEAGYILRKIRSENKIGAQHEQWCIRVQDVPSFFGGMSVRGLSSVQRDKLLAYRKGLYHRQSAIQPVAPTLDVTAFASAAVPLILEGIGDNLVQKFADKVSNVLQDALNPIHKALRSITKFIPESMMSRRHTQVALSHTKNLIRAGLLVGPKENAVTIHDMCQRINDVLEQTQKAGDTSPITAAEVWALLQKLNLNKAPWKKEDASLRMAMNRSTDVYEAKGLWNESVLKVLVYYTHIERFGVEQVHQALRSSIQNLVSTVLDRTLSA